MTAAAQNAREVDVLIVGAGLSGIGAAWRIAHELPHLTYAVLEARDRMGGTWDLFRYPGVRSDSDMATLSYPFRPWRGGRSLVDGTTILAYLEQTAAEGGIGPAVRFRTRATAAAWSGETARWTVTTVGPGGATAEVRCSFLYVCAGYYAYDRAHQPELIGVADFAGRVVTPQFWPADLDVTGRRVVVIGSGATAVTLVPALARTAAHVTMLQRSPSYVATVPAVDRFAGRLHRLLPTRAAYAVVRSRNIAVADLAYRAARAFPDATRRYLRRVALRTLRDPAYVDRHFAPRYPPWDQRLCLTPDDELFRALAAGRASVVTDGVARLDRAGVVLGSGERLAVDVVVTATGLELVPLGGLTLTVGGRPVDLGATTAWRAHLLSGVPNLAFAIGYANASWTLRSDLTARAVVRLLRAMDRRGWRAVTPRPPESGHRRPLIGLRSGYVQRAAARFPQQGDRDPWRAGTHYPADLLAAWTSDPWRELDVAPREPEPVTAGSRAAAARTRTR